MCTDARSSRAPAGLHRAFILGIALLLALACGGGVPMGGTCDATSDCADDGVCLKGVCSGYACDNDDECDHGLVCRFVAGGRACVTECDADDDCDGEQTCRAAPDAADTAAPDSGDRFCL